MCLVCSQPVADEMNKGRDQFGNEIVWWSPSSHYWHDDGVFCSAQHGLDYYQAKKGRIQET